MKKLEKSEFIEKAMRQILDGLSNDKCIGYMSLIIFAEENKMRTEGLGGGLFPEYIIKDINFIFNREFKKYMDELELQLIAEQQEEKNEHWIN